MPELPEVEIVRRDLEGHLLGRRLVAVEVREARLRWPIPVDDFVRTLAGRTIRGIRRRAKYLMVDLDGPEVLVLHLGMSGQLLVLDEPEPLDAHDHVLFDIGRGEQLRFRDPRRFGSAFTCPTDALDAHPRFRDLGIEPLSRDCTPAILHAASRGRRAPIKAFLMDARIVVGVGNIYASETLFRAGVHPRRAAGRTSLATWERLVPLLRDVLREAIAGGGSSISDYRRLDGRAGLYQETHHVYDREGEECPRCEGGHIARVVISGRSTYYCTRCQR